MACLMTSVAQGTKILPMLAAHSGVREVMDLQLVGTTHAIPTSTTRPVECALSALLPSRRPQVLPVLPLSFTPSSATSFSPVL